jgi:hypothetical protein
METVLEIVQTISALLPQLASITEQAIAAYNANDQATLDSLQKQAVAASNALAPAGGTPPVTVG